MKNIPVVPTSVTKTPVDKAQLWQTAKRERGKERGILSKEGEGWWEIDNGEEIKLCSIRSRQIYGRYY